MLGDVVIRGRLVTTDAGVVFAGRLVDQLVAVVMLSGGAETDSFARARFEAAAQALFDDGNGDVVAIDCNADIAPWVAILVRDGWSEVLGIAQRLLAPVTLRDVAPVGAVHGPDFRPYWYARRGIGRWRVWPLPWPDVLGPAGRWTFVAAFGLVLAIAALALWIATRVFDTQPPAPQPPQVTRTVPLPPPVTLPQPSSPLPSDPTGPPGASTGPVLPAPIPPIM